MGHFDCGQCSMCGCLFSLSVDEFEASAMPKAKETEAQAEPDDGEEDGREEGRFLICPSCIKITNCITETLEVGRFQHYSLVYLVYPTGGS